jgi:hypothetical protein
MRMFCFLTILASLLCCQCKSRTAEATGYSKLLESLSKATNKDIHSYSAIFFVPSEGCGGCISGAENFLLHNYLQEGGSGFLFVVTGLSSPKNARIRFGEIALASPDVYFDYNNIYNKPPFMQEFPKVLILTKGIVQKEIELNPATSDEAYVLLGKMTKSKNL